MKRKLKPSIAATLAALLASTLALGAEASVVTFDLNYNFGAVNSQGNVIVTITDASGNVTISVTNNSAGFISDLFLNYNPSSDLAGATITGFDDIAGVVSQPSVNFNALQGFAIDFGYQTANNAGRFGPGEAVTFELDATAALTAGGFNKLGGGPTGDDYYAATLPAAMIRDCLHWPCLNLRRSRCSVSASLASACRAAGIARARRIEPHRTFAVATNTNPVRPGKQPWHAVSVVARVAACPATARLGDQRFLSDEAPRLPLPDCVSTWRCNCVYLHYPDRRGGLRRETDRGVYPRPRFGIERRQRHGRRASDHD
jgi:hypothetical protein